jgi:hypothetical protein
MQQLLLRMQEKLGNNASLRTRFSALDLSDGTRYENWET